MLKALTYLIAVLIAIGLIVQGIVAFHNHAYKYGKTICQNEQLAKYNEQYKKAVDFIAKQADQQQQIEDIINKSKDNSKVTSPAIIGTLKRVRDNCSGKPTC